MSDLIKLVVCIVGGLIALVCIALGVYKRKAIRQYCSKESRQGRKEVAATRKVERGAVKVEKARIKAANKQAVKTRTDFI